MAFRILSLDGGGTWALLQAMALEKLYPDQPGRAILGNFDLTVANSGGSIVLAGLMLNKKPLEILSEFNNIEFRKSIFYKRNILVRLFTSIPFVSRYVTTEKAKGLAKAFTNAGDKLLCDFKDLKDWPKRPESKTESDEAKRPPTRVLITAFDHDRLRETFFRSYGIPGTAGQTATAISLRDAVHASTNAPVRFFDAPAICVVDGATRNYWDGAIGGYNNPVMAGVVDALALGVEAKEIQILSIGTGTVRLLTADQVSPGSPKPAKGLMAPGQGGPFGDLATVATSINDDPPDAASYTAYRVTRRPPVPPPATPAEEPIQLVRMNPVVRPEWSAGAGWVYPKLIPQPLFDKLAKLEMDAIEQDDVDTITQLGNVWLGGAPNQFIHDYQTFGTGLGHATFEKAKECWKTLSQ